MREIVLILITMFLISCLNDNGGEKYPPLKQEDVLGCWFEVPAFIGVCNEYCFDSLDRTYSFSIDGVTKLHDMEKVGTYSIEKNSIIRSVEVLYRKSTKSENRGERRDYFFRSDTLWKINSLGNYGRVFLIPTDSNHNCGRHFQLHDRPADWYLKDHEEAAYPE